jgi:uncharacterized coiled-coil protein SlyX
MTAPLTTTRKNKEVIIKNMIETLIEMLTYARGRLDRMDMRKLRELSNNLKELKEKAKPL